MSASEPTLAALFHAEVRKLASRVSVRLSLSLLVLVAVGVPLLLFLLSQMMAPPPIDPSAAMDAPPPRELPRPDLATSVRYVLALRNFFLFRALIIAVVAVSIAGEFVARTLREDLVRPVSRAKVFAAKWLALQVFVALGVLVPLCIGLPLSLPLFGTEGAVGEELIGYALTWLGDAGFCTMVMAISLALRSVPGTIGGVFLYWVFDQFLGWALWGVVKARGIVEQVLAVWKMEEAVLWLDRAEALRPWLPSSAFNVYWDYSPGEPIIWQSYVALVLITGGSYGAALALFRRLDVD